MTPHRQIGWVAAATAALCALYSVVFSLSDGAWSYGAVRAAVCNALPAMLIGWLVAGRIAPIFWPVRGLAALPGIVLTLVSYALATYVATIMLLALTGETGREGQAGLFIRYFTGPAFVWQSFQGLAYGLIALLFGWLVQSERLRQETQVPRIEISAPPPAPLGRLLLRTEAGIVPVEADSIIRIAAADDYCEIILPAACHLARMSMAECERLLANEPMLRVHRSHLVNLRCLISAEPTGDGRLQLTMSNGDQLISSRAGARLIREQSG